MKRIKLEGFTVNRKYAGYYLAERGYLDSFGKITRQLLRLPISIFGEIETGKTYDITLEKHVEHKSIGDILKHIKEK